MLPASLYRYEWDKRESLFDFKDGWSLELVHSLRDIALQARSIGAGEIDTYFSPSVYSLREPSGKPWATIVIAAHSYPVLSDDGLEPQGTIWPKLLKQINFKEGEFKELAKTHFEEWRRSEETCGRPVYTLSSSLRNEISPKIDLSPEDFVAWCSIIRWLAKDQDHKLVVLEPARDNNLDPERKVLGLPCVSERVLSFNPIYEDITDTIDNLISKSLKADPPGSFKIGKFSLVDLAEGIWAIWKQQNGGKKMSNEDIGDLCYYAGMRLNHFQAQYYDDEIKRLTAEATKSCGYDETEELSGEAKEQISQESNRKFSDEWRTISQDSRGLLKDLREIEKELKSKQ